MQVAPVQAGDPTAFAVMKSSQPLTLSLLVLSELLDHCIIVYLSNIAKLQSLMGFGVS